MQKDSSTGSLGKSCGCAKPGRSVNSYESSFFEKGAVRRTELLKEAPKSDGTSEPKESFSAASSATAFVNRAR